MLIEPDILHGEQSCSLNAVCTTHPYTKYRDGPEFNDICNTKKLHLFGWNVACNGYANCHKTEKVN